MRDYRETAFICTAPTRMRQPEVTRGVYPPGTIYPGQQRIAMRLGGQTVLIAPPHPHEPNATTPSFLITGWSTSG